MYIFRLMYTSCAHSWTGRDSFWYNFEMFKYICYYYSYKCTAHHEVIEHACSRHPWQALQFPKVTLNPENGRFGYSRMLYDDLIPLELVRSGKAILSPNAILAH